MANKHVVKATFAVENVIRPIFTGGAVALDKDAKILATALGEDAILTELTTGRHLAHVGGDGEPLSAMTITPSASHLVVCSRSLTTRLYSLRSTDEAVEAKLVRTWKPHATPVVVLAVDRIGALLATGAADGAIKIWDIVGGYVTHTVSGPSTLISALHFFEVAAGRQVGKYKSHGRGRAAKQQSSNGPRIQLAYGSQDGRLRLFDLQDNNTVSIRSDQGGEAHDSNIQSIDYSPHHHMLLTGGRDRIMTLWRLEDGVWKGSSMPRHELVEAVGFLDDGRQMYSAGSSGLLRVWEVATGRELTPVQEARSEAEAIVGAVHIAPSCLLLCIQADHTLALYQTPPATEATSQPFRRVSGTHDEILDLAYLLPDHSLMALATNSEDIRLVSVGSQSRRAVEASYFGQDIALLKGHEDIIMSVDVDWSGHWLATGAKDKTARLWRIGADAGGSSCYMTFTGHIESVGAVALPKTVPADSSPAFQTPLDHPPPFLITGAQDRFVQKRIIPRSRTGTATSLRRLAHEKDINAIDISPSGRLFASASQDKTVKIWDTETLEVQGILRGHRRGVWTVKFAPNRTPVLQGDGGPVSGKAIVLTGGGDKTIKLWNLTDYSCLRTFEGHSHNVLKVAWLKAVGDDKRTLFASAGGDGLVKVWDANGETECTLDNHEDRIWALAVHPEDNTLVSGGSDSTIVFWKDTTTESQAAVSEAARRLVEQEQELENYMHVGAYRDAIVLALQLNHPGRLLNLLTNVVTARPEEGSLCGLKAVDQVIADLSDEQIFLLLLRLRDWNTNARAAPIAQRILWTLVRTYPSSRLSNLSVKGARGEKSVREVLNALKVFTERHYQRIDALADQSYLIDEMDSLVPALDECTQLAGTSLVTLDSQES